MATPTTNMEGSKFGDGVRIQTIDQSGLTWINIERPTSRDMDYLAQQYHFHALDLEDCLSRIQRPKIDEYDEYVFIVLHFPRFHKDTQAMAPSQVCLFVGSDYVVTVHSGELKPLGKLFRECSLDHDMCYDHMKRGAGFLLYSIIDKLVDYCYPILNKIDESLEEAEDRVFHEATVKNVQETLLLRRNITAFRRIIRPQIVILASLEHKNWRFLPEEMGENLHVYFGNIGDHLNMIWDMLEEYREVSETLSDTSNWLASHQLQEVMRIMAIAAAIFGSLMVIPSIYGMNVPLPLGDSPWGLPVLVAIMVLMLVLLMWFIRRRGWL